MRGPVVGRLEGTESLAGGVAANVIVSGVVSGAITPGKGAPESVVEVVDNIALDTECLLGSVKPVSGKIDKRFRGDSCAAQRGGVSVDEGIGRKGSTQVSRDFSGDEFAECVANGLVILRGRIG